MCAARKNNRAAGFTLVETAIALFIIGLLLSGMLIAQKMVMQARVAATIKQIDAYRVATESFLSTYGQLPGDLEEAHMRIPGCSDVCNTVAAGINAGDRAVGRPDIGFAAFQSTPLKGSRPITEISATEAETVLFWYELMLADLIDGVTEEGVMNPAVTSQTWGDGLPEAKVGGGFRVVYVGISSINAPGNSKGFYGRPASSSHFPVLGTALYMTAQPDPYTFYLDEGYLPNKAELQAVTPHIAAQIDRKLDDGYPDLGQVQAFGPQSSCYAGLASPFKYQEDIATKDCGLIIGISK